jgi:hypothetical protein
MRPKSKMQKPTQQPSFLIKIDPDELYNKYKQGYFAREIPKKCSLILQQRMSLPGQAYQEPRRAGQSVTFVLTNTEAVKTYSKTKENLKGGRCDYCKMDFTTERIGYPLCYEQHQQSINDVYQIIHVFWVEGRCCS